MDKELLSEIRALGALCYTPEVVAQILGLSEAEQDRMTTDKACESYRQYWGGYYETDAKVRKSVFDLAAKGSSPAQAEARRLLEAAETRRFYEQ